MRKRPYQRSIARKLKRSTAVKRTVSITFVSALLVGAIGAGVPASAGGGLPDPAKLNEAYEKAAAALANAANPKPRANPLDEFLPAPGSSLNESISQLQNDLKDFFPKVSNKNPNDPNLINQNPGSVNSNQLNITVAKSMLVSAQPNGTPSMNVLLANTQVSGNGSATVKVPMGTETAKNSSGFAAPTMQGDSIVYDVQNGNQTVQSYGASNGNYQGDLPVRIDVSTWVNGEPVAPEDMVNVTGQVKMNYTFTNLTAQQTQISFKGPDGRIITQTKDIPVPFGGAFLVTLPPTFADVNAPWAQGGVSPLGTTLSGTVMMIPPIGKISQTLTIEARADQANLPSSSFQALPVTLTDQGIGRLVYEGLPVAGDLTNLATSAVAFGASDIVKLQALVLKYGAVAEGISNKYVRPFVQAFEDGQIDKAVAGGESQIQQLDEGAKALGLLLPQAQQVIGIVNTAVATATNLLEKNQKNIQGAAKLLSLASAKLDAALPQIDSTFTYIENYLPTAVDTGLKVAKAADVVCEKTKGIIDALGPSEAAIVATLNTIANALDFVGLHAEATKMRNLATQISDFYATAMDDLQVCIEYSDDAIALLTAAQQAMPQILAGLKFIDNSVNKAAGMLAKGSMTVNNFVYNVLPGLIYKLDHSTCKKTPSDIKNCGIKQQIAFLNQMMLLAAKTVNEQMVPGLNYVVDFLPTINKFVGLADKYIPIFGKKLEAMIPAAISGAEGGLDKGLTAVDKFGTYAAKAEITVASYTAQLEIMNARAQAGQGLPAGPAQGANTNLGAYQYQLAGASDQGKQNAILFGAAALLLVFSAGLGTFLYSRSR